MKKDDVAIAVQINRRMRAMPAEYVTEETKTKFLEIFGLGVVLNNKYVVIGQSTDLYNLFKLHLKEKVHKNVTLSASIKVGNEVIRQIRNDMELD